MLYHLFNYLQDTGFPGIRLMTYLSFRAMAAIDPSKITEKAEDYWIRTNIGEHNTGKE